MAQEEITARPGLSMEAVEAVGLVWDWEGYPAREEAAVGWMPYVSGICQSPGFQPSKDWYVHADRVRRRRAYADVGRRLPEEETPPHVTAGWARRQLRLVRWFCQDECPADHADGYIQEFLEVGVATWRIFFAGWGAEGEMWRRRILARAEEWGRVCALLTADADRLQLLL